MKNYITFSIFLVGAVLVNSFYLKAPFLGLALALIYLVYYGAKLGRLMLPKFDRFWMMLFGPLFLLASLSILGSSVYYIYNLSSRVIAGLILGIPIILAIPLAKIKPVPAKEEPGLEKVEIVLPAVSPANRLAILVLLIDGALFYYLFGQATTEAIRSPWLLVSPNFFLAFGLSTFLLILFLKATRRTFFALCTIFVHSALMLSVALVVYKLGYGFDPFVHRAAQDYIAKFGAVTPKTPYYIGQYALTVLLHTLTLLPLGSIDKILLPLLEALWLPPLVFLTLRLGLNMEAAASRLGALFFFLIPFGGLIATTPQDLANFYALNFLLWGALLMTSDLISIRPVLLFALAALITHPLVGLPILMAAALLLLAHYSPKRDWLKFAKRLFLTLTFFLAALALPAVLLLYANLKTGAPTLYLPNPSNILSRFSGLPPVPELRPKFSFHLGWALLYYYHHFSPIVYLLIAFFGAVSLAKKHRRFILWSMAVFLIFWLNILLLKATIIFPDVIDYEQNQYAGRLAKFSFYLLLPLFLYCLLYIFNRAAGKHKITVPIAAAALLTISFYFSYPRVDHYAFSRTFNVSAADFKAVEKIEELAHGKNYVVLSNQILSAASLQKFGFKKYYETPLGPMFYYALPTGGKLYRYYQKMVYEKPSRETALEVMDLTGASEVYLAVNDYWNSFNFVVPLAKKTADKWLEINSGKVIIFKYTR